MQEKGSTSAEAPDRFEHLLHRVQKGSDGATRLLIESYGPHILRVVRRRLSRRLRPKYDSLDFVQAVWASFFTRRNELPHFTRPEEMVAYLGAVAANKVIDETRIQFKPRGRAVRDAESLEPETPRHQDALTARQPSPSEAAQVGEFWDCLMEGQSSTCLRMIGLRRQGLSFEEIARAVGVTERTVSRIMNRLVNQRLPWVSTRR